MTERQPKCEHRNTHTGESLTGAHPGMTICDDCNEAWFGEAPSPALTKEQRDFFEAAKRACEGGRVFYDGFERIGQSYLIEDMFKAYRAMLSAKEEKPK